MGLVHDSVPAFPLFCWFQYADIVNLSIVQCNRIVFSDESYFDSITCAHGGSVSDKVIGRSGLLQTHFVCTTGKVGAEKLHSSFTQPQISYSATWVLPHTRQGIVSAMIMSLSFYYKKDTPTLLPKAVRCTLADAQEVSSAISIARVTAESKGESVAS